MPYLWIDATYVKVRQNGRIVSVAVIIAVGVNSDGRREVLGMDIGASEAETFWTAFLRKLAHRGLRGVKLVVSDSHEGIKVAVSKVLSTTWQRCRVGLLKKRPFPDSIALDDSRLCGVRHAWMQGAKSAGAIHQRVAAATHPRRSCALYTFRKAIRMYNDSTRECSGA